MSWILLTACFVAASDTDMAEVTPREALVRLSDEVQTGTLLVSRGDCLAVKIYSASAYTHVAAVVVRENGVFVYDAMGGAGVRKQLLGDYLEGLEGARVHPFQPVTPFSEKQQQAFAGHLESQLGRPYAIKHHLTGKRAKGLHCSEYVMDAMIAAELMHAKEPARVSPASLVVGILAAGLYEEQQSLQLVSEAPKHPSDENWCGWLWFETKECTLACCRKMRGWVFCK